jgi:hypothetical protein
VRNHQGLTPLVLAAHLGKEAMMQHIYKRRRRAFYTFGKVGCLVGAGCLQRPAHLAGPRRPRAGRAITVPSRPSRLRRRRPNAPPRPGQVTSYSLALREIDTVQDEEGYVPNCLETILRKVRAGAGGG